eukprot:CAMPEP_0195027544 /NCGR_PEP_ID=MMETSP0326_2-20130528/52477_1 /TAXON_ID=2866 ORGANISM="Crypthecodinium cohnii, Strain Seligo" /NCGR_SAMPLE_ID=MMETSP0326_2 /ASSEMBLY_ACC=CAM_ASM_000348 /LENGTH=70 /DNA_ID=CAMNT_0040049757 /DNA_START=327 /DNA_END=539 /DNA_ORIENTATION=+
MASRGNHRSFASIVQEKRHDVAANDQFARNASLRQRQERVTLIQFGHDVVQWETEVLLDGLDGVLLAKFF